MNGGSVHPVKWKPRKTSAVRDFPPGCGPIVVQPINVGFVEVEPIVQPINGVSVEAEPIVQPINVVVNEVEPLSSAVGDNHVGNGVGGEKPAGVIVESLVNNEVENGDVQVENGDSVVKEVVIRKMKFKRRRVSAVRHFPPYCGLNADEPTEEERIRINGMRRCGTESNGGVKDKLVQKTQVNEPKASSLANQEMQIVVSNGDAEDGKITKCESSKKVQNIGQACQELVIYQRDIVLSKSPPVDNALDVDDEEDARDSKPLSLVQKDMMVKDREVEFKKRVKKRPLDGTNNRVVVEDKIKVVVGLKAPAFCALEAQEQDSANKAKGHASKTPKAPISKIPKTQEKVGGASTYTGKVAYTGTPEVVEKDLTKKTKGDAVMTPKKTIKKEQKSKESGTQEMAEKNLTNKRKGDAVSTPKKAIKKEQKKKEKIAYTGTLEMVVRKEEDFVPDIEVKEVGFLDSQGADDVDVSLPPFGPKSSNDARNKVREILRLFQHLCRKLLQGEEARPDDLKLPKRRVDLSAKVIMDNRGRTLALGKKTHGPVPGVEVGDEFQYRVELALVGIHRPFQGGIDFVKIGNEFFAVSVVASGGYDNEVDKPDCLMYSGSGGVGKDKSFENQKLERGNLALKNNVELRYPVRVVRGYKVKSAELPDSKSKLSTTYIYDGLYTVESCQQVTGPHGNMVFKFELKRVPGQPQLAIREVKSKKFKTREGVCVQDITNGKEVFPICAINTIDDEKPPEFTYITKIMYPDWYKAIPPKGCECVGRCSDKRCSCAFRNGGEIPYNRNGAIVEAKPVVYECGPSCGCPPACYNRVTQRGMKIHLEIFKTESRGWGVRSVSSISSGSFICEYIGELLEDTEAEKRTGNDEYLFDIGQNYSDCSLNPDTKPEEIMNSGGGFTIDAAHYGNVGRFINHSCSPNLYAQNVLYDQDDKRMPHIMLFAAENIPPLQELTYHYNYAVDTVHDADGNIKVKNCYCGSPECTGRLY
ncbi:hypothetical protein QVD17_13314 [Tagetes erecta]|uniref:Uncharacterized protein n=1 Tax=Tagetes erecta TaxID=13708 RepID=A0AAD8L211_TARER|nr:hypothetical protein QVD17_13314 [Tagetes erecta]